MAPIPGSTPALRNAASARHGPNTKAVTPEGWIAARKIPKPGDPLYRVWIANKAEHAAKRAAETNGEDRSSWSTSDWQAWWAQSQAAVPCSALECRSRGE